MAERTNPHANLIIGAQDEATPVFDKIKASSQSMAAGVEQAATKAAGAVGGIGDKAAPAAQKLDGVTASMIRQVQRLNAELEAGSARNAAYFEKMATLKGADTAALAPYLAQLKQAEAAQRIATTGLDQMGMSAKQTAAALRQVPMQFTDIVVSLQGGQSAMQVFLQQGGQLKDMFGGAGNAARALGGYVLGLVNPFTIAAAAVAGIAVAYNQGSKEAEAFNKTLILTGNAAGASASSLADMARAIDATSAGITQSKAAEVLNSIAASGDVAADKLQRYAQVAIEFERAGGGAADEVAKAFSSLAGDPLAAVEKLNKSTNLLTAEIYNQIKALEDEGRSTDAARVAQDAYASMLDQRIPKLKDNLGLLERGWMGVKGAAAEAWDSMLNVGRAQTIGGRLEAAQKLLADYESTLPGKRTTEQVARVAEAGGVNGLRNQIAGLQELMETQRKADEQQRANNQSTQAAINLSKQASQFDTDLEKQRKAVAKATELYTTALAAGNLSESARAQLEKDYLKTVAGITAVKEQRATSTRKENKDLADQSRIFAELAGVSSTYYTELAAAQAQRAKGNVSEAQYVAYVNELIQKQPFAVALTKEEAKAQQTLDKANLDAAASREKYLTSLSTGLDKIQADIAAQEEATARLGLSKQAIADLDAAKLEMLATDLELQAIKALDRNLDQQTYDALKEQAKLYRDLAEAKKIGAAKETALDLEKANAEAAKKAAEDWQRASDDINRSLTDALLRGFESGKGFAKNLRDTIVNMFQTLVLRPTISAVLSPVSTAINGVVSSGLSALGIGGQAASMAGLFGVGGGATAASFAQNVATGVSVGLSSSEAIAAATAAGQAMGASAGTGFMASLSAVPGWGWALGGAALLGGLLGGRGETRSGGQYAWSSLRGTSLLAGPSGGEIDGANTRMAISATADGINALLKSLGSSVSLQSFQAGIESSKKNRGGVFAGGTLSSGVTFGQSGGGSNYDGTMYDPSKPFSGDAAAMVAAFKQEMAQATLEALKAAEDIPKSIKDQLDAVDIKGLSAEAATALATSIAQQAQDVATFREAMESLPFENLRNLSYDAAAALGTAAGGLGTLAQSLTSFANNTAFYTQAEIDARAMAELTATFAEFGQEMPTTTAEYRALVEQVAALAPASEVAAKGLAALLASADAFARIAANAANAISNAASSAQSAAFSASNQPADLAALQARFTAYNVAAPTNMIEYRALMAQAAAAAPTDPIAAKGLEELEASLNTASQLFTAAAQAAAPNWGPSFQNAGGGGASEKALADWKSATDSIKSTMDDLRKTLIDETKPSLAALQAQFAVAVAQAKAGDAMAAASLPDLAKAISAAGRERASSALEAALITARAAQALQDVLDARRVASAAPSYMGIEGTAALLGEPKPGPNPSGRTWLSQPEIDENMRYAQFSIQHYLDWYVPWMQSQSPEMPPPDRASAPNPVMEPDRMYIFTGGNGPGGNATEIADALAAMAERLAAIEAATRATQNATRSTADVLERASRGSQPLTTQVTP